MDKITLGIIGEFQNGKSTFVNCLLGTDIAKVGGFGKSVTFISTIYTYGSDNIALCYHNDDIIATYDIKSYKNSVIPKGTTKIVVKVKSKILKEYNIVDTPGFNANDDDDIMASNSLNNIDVALFLIINKGISKSELEIAKLLRRLCVPFLLIMNCMDVNQDMWNPNSEYNIDVERSIIGDLQLHHCKPVSILGERIVAVNILWYWHSIISHAMTDLEKKQRKRIYGFFEYVEERNVSINELRRLSGFENVRLALLSASFRSQIVLLSRLSRVMREHDRIMSINYRTYVAQYDNLLCKYHNTYRNKIVDTEEAVYEIENEIIVENKKVEEITNRTCLDFSYETKIGRFLSGLAHFIIDDLKKSSINSRLCNLIMRKELLQKEIEVDKDILRYINKLISIIND